MAITASDIVTTAYRKLGQPSQGDLPYQDVLDNARDVIRGKMLDLKLSARNHSVVTGGWVTPNAREMSSAGFVGGQLNVIPVSVEWRYNVSDRDTIPHKADIVAFEQLAELYHKSAFSNETFVSFYTANNVGMVAFSETEETLSQREYRVIYESMADVDFASLTSEAGIPELFVTLCGVETALLSLDAVENTTDEWMEKRERLRSSLSIEFAQHEKRFEKWSKTLYGNKTVRKIPFRRR